MPEGSGRAGTPGNQKVMRPVDIRMPHPELLQPGASRPQKTHETALKKKGRSRWPGKKIEKY